MKRVPVVATLVVLAAVLTMIGLGIWQLRRAEEKTALLGLYRANLEKPAISYPQLPPIPDEALFRRSSVMCLAVVGWDVDGGRAADGSTGYRHVARCRTGAEGPGVLVNMGVSRTPVARVSWPGGHVAGTIAIAPDHHSMIDRLLGRAPPPSPLLVADTPAPGLKPAARPDPQAIPNNHMAYVVQWFLFAAVASIIYLLALRRRWASLPR